MSEAPLVKAVVIAVFIMILLALGTAFLKLFRKKRDEADREGMVKALTLRVALSIGLVALIALLNALGIITPNG